MAEQSDTTNLPTRFQKAKPIGNVLMPTPLPDGVALENCYAVSLVGNCFEPFVTEGMRIVATGDLHPRSGDFAVIFLKGVVNDGPGGAVERIVHRYPRHKIVRKHTQQAQHN